MTLTHAQARMLRAISRFWRENGYAPCLRELGAELGICKRGAHDMVLRLERLGLVTHKPHDGRTLRLTDLAVASLTLFAEAPDSAA